MLVFGSHRDLLGNRPMALSSRLAPLVALLVATLIAGLPGNALSAELAPNDGDPTQEPHTEGVAQSAGNSGADGFDTKLPLSGIVDELSDGAWVCPTMASAYLSVSDRHDWVRIDTGLPADRQIMRCLGGSRKRMYFVASTKPWGSEYAVYAVEPGRKPIDVHVMPSLLTPPAAVPAAFCSDSVGALSTGANVNATVDGGATWHPTAPLFTTENAQIREIERVDNSRLAIADGKSLALFEVRPDATLNQIWRITAPGGVGLLRSPCDRSHVWVTEEEGMKRLNLTNGDADLVVPWKTIGSDQRYLIRIFPIWDNAFILWSRDLEKAKMVQETSVCGTTPTPEQQASIDAGLDKVRALTQKADGTYTAGRWFPTNGFAVVPSVKPHCLLLAIKGEARDFDLAADTLTPTSLHVVPPEPKPQEPAPASIKLFQDVVHLGRQLPAAEEEAIGERVIKRKDLKGDQALGLMKQEYQRAIDKHKAEGTLPPPRVNVAEQLDDLEKQLSEKEIDDIQTRANAKQFVSLDERLHWLKDEYEKAIAKHKTEGAAPKAGSTAKPGSTARPEAAPPAPAAPKPPAPQSIMCQILHLAEQLPDNEVQQVWTDARREGPNDPAKARLWVRDRMADLVAKHKADRTLAKPKSEAPDKK
jgi:hypothetical protein